MANHSIGSSEEEALFRSYPYAALYFVQSPTTTVSHYNQDVISFHSPATQRRLALSHYSSSRGSTNSCLHEKKISYGPQESPDHDSVDRVLVKVGEKGSDFVGGNNVHCAADALGMDAGESEEEAKGLGKRMWDFVSFSHSDSCVWIWFQISLRLTLSFGVALLFFYLITKPPPPRIYLNVERMTEFQLAEGVDNSGVTTKFLTCNSSINLLVNIKSSLYGLHIHPEVLILSFNNIPIVTSLETQTLYASSNGPTSFLLYLGTNNKPMYGAGRSMQDILDSGKGLLLVVHVTLRSRFHVVGKLVSPKYHYRAECILILFKTHDKQHKTVRYNNHCNLL